MPPAPAPIARRVARSNSGGFLDSVSSAIHDAAPAQLKWGAYLTGVGKPWKKDPLVNSFTNDVWTADATPKVTNS